MTLKVFTIILAIMLSSAQAYASDILNNSQMSLWWIVPFFGVILSLALCPIVTPKIWSSHYGKINLFWASLTLISILHNHDALSGASVLMETAINHLIPFIMMISALYIVTGNIRIDVSVPATPIINTTILIIGTVLSNIIGTTGASMLLIKPLIHVNRQRRYHQHSMIFFIFLVSNIGGCLTPLGDPPLFIGFLNGVSFTWLVTHMWCPLIIIAIPLLIIYFLIDYYLCKYKDNHPKTLQQVPSFFKIYGYHQFILIAAIIMTIIVNGLWASTTSFMITENHSILLKDTVRDGSLLLIAVVSYMTGNQATRQQNNFSWHPLIEISKIFAAIFITAIPVIAILKAGHDGALHSVVNSVATSGNPLPSAYFWLTGILSAFLDNAPTYLIFFNIAGGDAYRLMGSMSSVLTAISTGAVFMGALSYIGNAPNFMVKSIAEQENICMPSFFGYLIWSCGILLPLFVILNIVMF